jgi:hypothetical protein
MVTASAVSPTAAALWRRSDMSDEEEKRPKDVFRDRCSVTAYDLEVFISEDGRKRGLWVGAGDEGEERPKALKKTLDGALENWFQARKGRGDEGSITEISRRYDLLNLFQESSKEMGLLEWSAAEKLHKALGEALSRRPIGDDMDTDSVRVIPTDEVIEFGKRTRIPVQLAVRCPQCDDMVISDLSGKDGYLSYPKTNEPTEIQFSHSCGAAWEKKLILKVTMEPVEEDEIGDHLL